MALTSSNVGVAVTGEIYFANVGTTLPTTTSAALTSFTGTGYLGEDGIQEQPEVSREALKAWQNGATVRETVTEAKLTYAFTMIETTKGNVELYYGTTVTQAAAHGSYTYTVGATKGRKAWVIDVVDGAEVRRETIAEAELFQGDGVTLANGAAIGYPCELVCYTAPVIYDTRLKTPA